MMEEPAEEAENGALASPPERPHQATLSFTRKAEIKQTPGHQTSLLDWIFEFVQDWLATTMIGFLVVSYWRGTWVLLDLYTCGQPEDATLVDGNSFCFGIETTREERFISGWGTYLAGNGLLLIGIHCMWMGYWIPKQGGKTVSFGTGSLRVALVYVLGAATVNIWHGIWYLTDYWILPNEPVTSWWITTCCGIAGAFLIFAGPSLLAPPAIFNLDGPSLCPPPITVTIASSFYSITVPYSSDPPEMTTLAYGMDIILSFVVLPWFVVWFWRGSWLLMDNYLWGLTLDVSDVHASLGYGTVLAYGLLVLGSDDVFSWIPSSSVLLNRVTTRLRTLMLAVGAVSFWRVVWLLWDEFFGGTSYWSAWLSHVLGVVGLTVLGCFSCVCAPPTTLGVDAVANEDSSDEPLFQDVPVPAETLFFFGIGRDPLLVTKKKKDEEEDKEDVVQHKGGLKKSLLQRSRPEFDSLFGSARVRRSDVNSVTSSILSDRNAKKRLQNQFFRSR